MLCQSHLASSANASRHVAVFEVHDRNMIDAPLVFGQQEHLGVGIDYIDAAALQQRVTIRLRAATVADVLDAITHRFGYRWSSSGRLVRITHPGAMVGSRNLLNTRIAKFKVSEMPLEQANCELKSAFYFALNPKSSGIVGDCPYGGIEYQISQRSLGGTAAAVDNGQRPGARIVESAGLRQDGWRVQPGIASAGPGSAKPLTILNSCNIEITLIDLVVSEIACLQLTFSQTVVGKVPLTNGRCAGLR